MNDSQLDQLLRSAPLPEHTAEYWGDFPGSVLRRLRSEVHPPAPGRSAPRFPRFLPWGLGLASACVVLGFVLGFWRGHESGLQASQVAALRTYYREIQALFPNQVRALIIDEQGPRLVLADRPDVPTSTPLLLSIRTRSGSQSVLTFSGQQIRVDGELCEVLADTHGHVLLVGDKLVWSSGQHGPRTAPYRIQAQPLQTL